MRFALLLAASLLASIGPAAAGWNDGYGNSGDTYTPVTNDSPGVVTSPAAPDYGSGQAKAPTAPASGGHSFGSVNCPQHVDCSAGSANVTQLAGYANMCITQYFGYGSETGFFEESSGVGTDGCLTAKPNAIPKGIGSQLAPHCCIVQAQENSCILRCSLIVAQ